MKRKIAVSIVSHFFDIHDEGKTWCLSFSALKYHVILYRLHITSLFEVYMWKCRHVERRFDTQRICDVIFLV